MRYKLLEAFMPPAPDHLPNGDTTAAWVVNLFLARLNGLRGDAERARILRLFVADLGQLSLADCRPFHLDDWLAARTGHMSQWTQRRWLATIQAPFNFAAKSGRIDRNPFLGVTRKPGRRGQPLTEDHYRAAMAAARGPFRHVLFFERMTGARPGEMSALEWAHLDLERGIAVLCEHKSIDQLAEPRPRVIALHPLVVRLLRVLYRKRRPGQRHVFVGARGQPWTRNALYLRFRRIREKTGMPKSCKLYGLRHLFGTRLAMSGANAATIAELMGHADFRMSMHYIHLAGEREHLARAVEQAFRQR